MKTQVLFRFDMKQELLSLPVTQSDETPTQVIGDSDRPNSKCHMWVHRSGEFNIDRPVVIYEYQKGRDRKNPVAYRALQKIAEFYNIDTGLKELPKDERLFP